MANRADSEGRWWRWSTRSVLVVAALSLGLGIAASFALGSYAPGWERIWAVVAILGGFLVTRPVRRFVLWLKPFSLGDVGAVLAAIAIGAALGAAVGAYFSEKLDWRWLLLGGAVVGVAAVFALLTRAGRLHRLLSLVVFAVGFAGTAIVLDAFDSERALDWQWYAYFVPLALAGIALADLFGRLLQDLLFSRLPWEALLLAGVGAAALLYFQVAPRLAEEDERLERKPVLPVGNGPIAYARQVRDKVVIEVTRPEGTAKVLISQAKPNSAVSWSPDGDRLAFVRDLGETSAVCTLELESSTPACITEEPGDYRDPTWSADGKRLAFTKTTVGNGDIYVACVDEARKKKPVRLTQTCVGAASKDNPVQLTHTPDVSEIEPTWSPDGDEIAFASDRTGQFDIYVIAANGARPARLSRGPTFGADDRQPQWSPHGRTIAFVSRSEPAGKTDIFLVDADGRGRLRNLTKDAGKSSDDPVWSPDSTAIAFTRSGAIHRLFLQGVEKLDPGDAERVDEARAPASHPAWRPLPEPDMPKHAFPGPVRKYAPLVRLHSTERYWPMGASAFIRISRLDWVGCDPARVSRQPPAEERLGGEPPGDADDYRYAPKGCPGGNRVRSVLEATRPRDRDDLGFVLTPRVDAPRGPAPTTRNTDSAGEDDARTFVRASVPVYYEYVPRRSITYWTFYGFSATSPAGRQGEHQGDWERVTVCLDRSGHAIGVVYHRHNFNRSRRWSLVPKFGSHPIVYSANGSHASYSSAGTNPVLETFDRRDEGPIWPTWENLRDVFRQRWYGYGGSWGNPPAPEGPSRYKVGDEGC